MQSTTAIRRLKAEASGPIRGRPASRWSKKGQYATGFGLTEGDLRRWFVLNGFRGDGDKCAWKRWLNDWLDVGLVIPFYLDDNGLGKGYWWSEIKSIDVASVNYLAGEEGDPQSGIYELNGMVAKEKLLAIQGRSE